MRATSAVVAMATAALLLAGCSDAGTLGAAGANPTDVAAPVGVTTATGADPTVAGTDGEAGTTSAPADATRSAPTSAPTSVPPPEPTGPEPAGSTVRKPSVIVVGAPVGGGVFDDTRVEQCLPLSYLSTAPVPRPVRVVITGVTLRGTRMFSVGGKGCSGEGLPGCVGHVWTPARIAAGGDLCVVPLRATGKGTVDDEQEVGVTVRVECGTLSDRACAAYATVLDHDGQRAPLHLSQNLYDTLHPNPTPSADPQPTDS